MERCCDLTENRLQFALIVRWSAEMVMDSSYQRARARGKVIGLRQRKALVSGDPLEIAVKARPRGSSIMIKCRDNSQIEVSPSSLFSFVFFLYFALKGRKSSSFAFIFSRSATDDIAYISRSGLVLAHPRALSVWGWLALISCNRRSLQCECLKSVSESGPARR